MDNGLRFTGRYDSRGHPIHEPRRQRWHCTRCDQPVDDSTGRCECTESPSPRVPVATKPKLRKPIDQWTEEDVEAFRVWSEKIMRWTIVVTFGGCALLALAMMLWQLILTFNQLRIFHQ